MNDPIKTPIIISFQLFRHNRANAVQDDNNPDECTGRFAVHVQLTDHPYRSQFGERYEGFETNPQRCCRHFDFVSAQNGTTEKESIEDALH